ncbi:TRAP transporter substrate-binding protein [Halomonas sp. AOP35-4E-18]|uniref:TRAP transporter substrate-binding protein n=1 Tax=Halomonas sp. AOP35-4E-18 TaxID=3457686 RepID=UPI00403387F6
MSAIKKSVLGISIGVVSVVLSGVTQSTLAASVNLRLAHVVNDKDIFHTAAEKFQELVEEKSEGEVSISIYPNATLGVERTILEGMQMGTIDMGVISNGPASNFVKPLAAIEMPFLFESAEEAHEILDGEIGDQLLQSLESVNLKGLAYTERGFRALTNSRGPVESPEDIEGLTIRVVENEIYRDTFETWGANGVLMSWPEAMTALQQGAIDGQETPVNVSHAFNLDEVQQHLTLTRHIYAPAIFIMGISSWNRLNEDQQDIVTSAAREAGAYARAENSRLEEIQVQELEERGMLVVRNPDREAFKASVSSVYEKYQAQFGDVIDAVEESRKDRE